MHFCGRSGSDSMQATGCMTLYCIDCIEGFLSGMEEVRWLEGLTAGWSDGKRLGLCTNNQDHEH